MHFAASESVCPAMSGQKRWADWAGLWMRVDGPHGQPLAFDNVDAAQLRERHDWTRCEVVLDVAEQAQEIAFGLLLAGSGQAGWTT